MDTERGVEVGEGMTGDDDADVWGGSVEGMFLGLRYSMLLLRSSARWDAGVGVLPGSD